MTTRLSLTIAICVEVNRVRDTIDGVGSFESGVIFELSVKLERRLMSISSLSRGVYGEVEF